MYEKEIVQYRPSLEKSSSLLRDLPATPGIHDNLHYRPLLAKRLSIIEKLEQLLECFEGIYHDKCISILDVRELEQRLPKVESLLAKYLNLEEQLEIIRGSQDIMARKNVEEVILEIIKIVKLILRNKTIVKTYHPQSVILENHLRRIIRKIHLISKSDNNFEIRKCQYLYSDKIAFLQAFRKPSLIEAFILAKHNSPLFLNRNLEYMQHRMSRKHIARNNFKVDSMLYFYNKDQNYLTIDVIGLQTNLDLETAKLDVTLGNFVRGKNSVKEHFRPFDMPINQPMRIPQRITFLVQAGKSCKKGYNLCFKLTTTNARQVPKKRKPLAEISANITEKEFIEVIKLFSEEEADFIKSGKFSFNLYNPFYYSEDIVFLEVYLKWHKNPILSLKNPIIKPERPIPKVIYEFQYRCVRQSTSPCENVICPWCHLDCHDINVLLKHLNYIHSNYVFTSRLISDTVWITVKKNEPECYAYSNDLFGPCNDCETKTRVFFKKLKVGRCVRANTDSTIHKQCYQNSGLPLNLPQNFGIDNDELETEWLKQYMDKKMNKNSFLQPNDKEFMKMWNRHMMKYQFVGDCHIPLACELFMKIHWRQILEKGLYANVLIHLSTLVEYGVINSTFMFNLLVKFLQKRCNNAPI